MNFILKVFSSCTISIRKNQLLFSPSYSYGKSVLFIFLGVHMEESRIGSRKATIRLNAIHVHFRFVVAVSGESCIEGNLQHY